MKKLLLLLLISIPFISYAQQYDMSYITFTKYIKQEMTDEEFKSIDDYFGGNVRGIVCFYDYGEFSGDNIDDFAVLTYEDDQEVNVCIFRGNPIGKFDFVDKVTYKFWKSRYEVAILIKRGILYVTSTDPDYEKWTWANYRVHSGKLELVKNDVYNQ